MGFFKNLDIMFHNREDDYTIAKWVHEASKGNMEMLDALIFVGKLREDWEAIR